MSEEEKTEHAVTSDQVIDQARKLAKVSDEVFLSIVRGVGDAAVRVLSGSVTVGRAARKAAGVSASVTQMAIKAARKQISEIAERIEEAPEGSTVEEEDLLSKAKGEESPGAADEQGSDAGEEAAPPTEDDDAAKGPKDEGPAAETEGGGTDEDDAVEEKDAGDDAGKE